MTLPTSTPAIRTGESGFSPCTRGKTASISWPCDHGSPPRKASRMPPAATTIARAPTTQFGSARRRFVPRVGGVALTDLVPQVVGAREATRVSRSTRLPSGRK